MAMDRRIGREPPDYYRREESAIRLDSGPYLGKVKNNLDPTRSGRLQVYIPDLTSGDENNPEFWRTVAYASPYMGSTSQPDTNKQNAYSKVKHTYGLWTVPPDIGNLVMCTFIAGDPNRGFWFACVPSQLGHHMLPGMAGSYEVDSSNIENSKVKSNYNNKPTIVAEFNENNEEVEWSNFVNLKKPIHESQYLVLLNQGLEEDYVRGIISSSSQRETPSTVFGISTPGRPTKDSATDSNYNKRINSGEVREEDYAVPTRKGGHVFVMDDGNFQDKDRLIRLRTAGGHQILLNDSENILYIGNSTGSVWIELTGPGHLNIYTGNSVNVRAEGDLNFHADRNIHLNAGAEILVSAGQNIRAQGKNIDLNAAESSTLFAGTTLNLGGASSVNVNSSGIANVVGSSGVNLSGSQVKLNSGVSGSASFSRPEQIKFNKLSDTGKQGDRWVSVDSSLQTIVPIAPTHEPWSLHAGTTLAGVTKATGPAAEAATGGVLTSSDGTPVTSESGNVITGEPPSKELPAVECQNTPSSDPGPRSAQGVGVKNPVNKSYLSRQDNPTVTEGVGPLTPEQTRALMTQIGWSESTYNYRAENRFSYIGKYQTGAAALVDLGYIKRDAYQLYGNKAVNYPTSWTGKDGVNSKEQYLGNGTVQEKVMIALLKMNYKTLQRIGAIKDSDDQCTVAGMLAAAHLIGAGGAKQWRLTGAGADANGTTGATYFNMGRYAVDVLAAPTATA